MLIVFVIIKISCNEYVQLLACEIVSYIVQVDFFFFLNCLVYYVFVERENWIKDDQDSRVILIYIERKRNID